MLYGEIGQTNVDTVIKNRMLGFWVRIVTGKDCKFSRIIYNISKSAHDDPTNEFSSSWLSKIHQILNETGYDYLWPTNPCPIAMNMISSVKNCLSSNFHESWSNEKANNERCSLYTLFKSHPSQERYLQILSSADAISIAKLRTNNCNVIPTNKFKYSHA